MRLTPIGEVVEGYPSTESAPRQGIFGDKVSRIKIYDEFSDGLEGLEGFDRIIVLYWFHLSRRDVLKVKPSWTDGVRGVFSIRSPERPNPIGLSVVELLGIENNVLVVRNLDAVTGTPVIDIKPFFMEIDCY
ncbi:tRNA (N6-threonylcarbamoyladenosine(37)-N6)-methyltransferase TrmO [Geoglobus acetivorans]|uniref:tRNA (N6-threonylcarbamoyladenosine(37)-N6)-methyltransferase TrmO n=1 Tax=Geoglobus acetivorans TaxID=565033 RepID=A0ABZ3H307_GEOAI|nr:tRNA (N6-threonylcarbamoyladenosine(37)-N6)-methyltransferase TrmO [Geoglobus acetivorans]